MYHLQLYTIWVHYFDWHNLFLRENSDVNILIYDDFNKTASEKVK